MDLRQCTGWMAIEILSLLLVHSSASGTFQWRLAACHLARRIVFEVLQWKRSLRRIGSRSVNVFNRGRVGTRLRNFNRRLYVPSMSDLRGRDNRSDAGWVEIR